MSECLNLSILNFQGLLFILVMILPDRSLFEVPLFTCSRMFSSRSRITRLAGYIRQLEQVNTSCRKERPFKEIGPSYVKYRRQNCQAGTFKLFKVSLKSHLKK